MFEDDYGWRIETCTVCAGLVAWRVWHEGALVLYGFADSDVQAYRDSEAAVRRLELEECILPDGEEPL